jgi:Fe-coproporphyrin III synthase
MTLAPLAAASRKSRWSSTLLVQLGATTNRTYVLPLVIFYPTSRCNSRCVSCDWWKSSGADDLTLDEIAAVASALPALGTRVVAFSGGEPLLRPDVFAIAALFRDRGMTLHLLTSGVLLERCAPEVGRCFAHVTISLDASRAGLYEAVRGIRALDRVEQGVKTLRRAAPDLPITARATLHRANFRDMPSIVDKALAMRLDGLSFLAADVSSSAFGRTAPADASELALTADEIDEFEAIVERTVIEFSDEFERGFIAESPEKLRNLPQYYAALAGQTPFPRVTCNAPSVSVVLEANGGVRPCFFHRPIGSVRSEPLADIVRRALPEFRRGLDMATDPTCTRCVCSMKTGWRAHTW